MGYYTDYELDIDRLSFPEGFNDVFVEITGYSVNNLYSIKWHSYAEDMKVISTKYPDILFEVTGKEEDAEDLWKAYFKNGKMQYCKGKVVYDDFDESKLV